MNDKPRKPTPWWDLLPYATVALATSIGATQFAAWRFHNNPVLGKPVVDGFYLPWSWLTWQLQFGKQGAATFSIVNMVCILIFGSLLYGYMTMRTLRARSSKGPEGVHGTAHFADAQEVRDTGLLAENTGVYVGAWIDEKGVTHYLRHDGPEHIAAIAPTRSGKGVGLVIPTLLSWPKSAVIHDMKGELWNLTAGYRKKGLKNVVLKFDPAAKTGSCRFNPLAEVRLDKDYAVADVQNLVTIIVDPDGKGLQDHWTKTAHAFLTGVVLYMLYKAKEAGKDTPSLGAVMLALSEPNRPIDQLYKDMEQYPHSVIAASARDMIDRADAERTSVLSSVKSYLSLYRDSLVEQNTSLSDFKISDLMNHDKPVSLYLVVRPADKDRLKPLMRLIINQIVRTLSRDEIVFENGQAKPPKNRLLLMLDEFPSFGKLEVFQEALAFIAGYGMKAYLIMQDITQLHAAYGVHESIISNCHIRVAYAPNNPKTAEWLSRMLGTTTKIWKAAAVSGQRTGGLLKNVSESYQSTGRPLMTPDEVMRLKAPKKNTKGDILKSGEMLIFVSGQTPIKGTQILYFQEDFFLTASRVSAPKDSEKIGRERETILLKASIPNLNAPLVESETQSCKPPVQEHTLVQTVHSL